MKQIIRQPSTDEILEVFEELSQKAGRQLSSKEERFITFLTTPEGRRVKRKINELTKRKDPFIAKKDEELINHAFFRHFDIIDYFPELLNPEERKQNSVPQETKQPKLSFSLDNWENDNDSNENDSKIPLNQKPIELKPLQKLGSHTSGKVEVRQGAKLPDFIKDDYDFFNKEEPPEKERVSKQRRRLDKDDIPSGMGKNANDQTNKKKRHQVVQDRSFFDTDEQVTPDEIKEEVAEASFEKAFQDAAEENEPSSLNRTSAKREKEKEPFLKQLLTKKYYLAALAIVLLVVISKSLSLIPHLPQKSGSIEEAIKKVKKVKKRTPFPKLLAEGELLAIARFIRDSRGKPLHEEGSLTEEDKIVSTHFLIRHKPEGYIDLSLNGRSEDVVDMISFHTIGEKEEEEEAYLKTFWDNYRTVEGVRLINPIVLEKKPRIVIENLTIYLRDFPKEPEEP